MVASNTISTPKIDFSLSRLGVAFLLKGVADNLFHYTSVKFNFTCRLPEQAFFLSLKSHRAKSKPGMKTDKCN